MLEESMLLAVVLGLTTFCAIKQNYNERVNLNFRHIIRKLKKEVSLLI